jgi:hypothetical protein
MMQGARPRHGRVLRGRIETVERERLRRSQIPHAVFVVNRERLIRFAGDDRRAPSDVEQLLPASSGFVELTNAAPSEGQRPQRFDFRDIESARRRR